MHNILIDLSCLQAGPKAGGAAAYTTTVLNSLCCKKNENTLVFGLYNSNKQFHPLYNVEYFVKTHNINLVDICNTSISKIIHSCEINTFFIPVGQYIMPYDLSNITCRTIVMIHDIYDIEASDIGIDVILRDSNIQSLIDYVKSLINHFTKRKKYLVRKAYQNFMSFCSKPNVELLTVSEYTRSSLLYYNPTWTKQIKVLYSPEKKIKKSEIVEDSMLDSIIQQKKKYFLLVSANRIYKNANNVLKAFAAFSKLYPDYYIVTINYGKSTFKNHLSIKTLSESDLEHAYQNAEALIFASYFEGFGYPPVEAMKYGTPIIASNVTSIPEITESGGIYFSPFYPASIYNTLVHFIESDKRLYHNKSLNRYKQLTLRQYQDLNQLIQIIIS